MEYSYCPACGGPLEQIDWEDGLTIPRCGECGFRMYRNSKPCAVGVITDRQQGKILLTRRGVSPYKGCWDMPGGFLRNGENPEKGMKREIGEELGVDCEIEELFDIVVDTYGSADVFTFNVCYIIRITGGEITPMDDVAEARWFSFSELPENLAFTHMEDIIMRVRDHLNIPVP